MLCKHEAHLRIREPIVDGIFYPEDADELRREVDSLLSKTAAVPGSPAALVSPHGGFSHSGAVAAEAFKAASGRSGVKTVLILAPIHRDPVNAFFLTESGSFRTPLGDVSVNQRLNEALHDCGTLFTTNDIPHLEEHAIEVQIPFMQRVFPGASVVPILMGRTTLANVRALTDALSTVIPVNDRETLIVVSANLSSFSPVAESTASAETLLDLLKSGDWEALVNAGMSGGVSSLGAGCMAAVSAYFAGRAVPTVLATASSAREVEEPENEVRYGAVTFEVKGGK